MHIPTIWLENIEFTNLYLLNNDLGCQTLIKTSPLPSGVNFKNVVFKNNYLTLGILKQMKFNEDPYFGLHPPEVNLTNILEKYKMSSSTYGPLAHLTLSNVTITEHHSVSFSETSTESSQLYPYSSLFETKAEMALKIRNLSVTDSWLPENKNYLLFKFSQGSYDNGSAYFDSISLMKCSNLAVINSLNTEIKANYLSLKLCVFNSSLSPFSFYSRGPLAIRST